MTRGVINQVRLILRLLGDKRVNFFFKLIPIAALGYLIFPFDGDLVLPVIGLVDDAMVLWLGSYAFIEICPPDVVDEHRKALAGEPRPFAKENDVVEAEVLETKEEASQ